jgi:hypothetical protein
MECRVSLLTAEILVDGEPKVVVNNYFQCRDSLIPNVHHKLKALVGQGHVLEVTREQRFELETSNPRVIDWDGIMGSNAHVSPLASPFLLRFYIGRVRNGYQYAKLEKALRVAGEEGVTIPDLVTAWNLTSWGDGLGLGNILSNVRSWDYGRKIDYAKIFPPYKFI